MEGLPLPSDSPVSQPWSALELMDSFHRLTFTDSFTCVSGPSTAKPVFMRATLAKVLNPAPGNHSGTYLTGLGRKLNHSFLGLMWDSRIGNISIRNAPGITALVISSAASTAARRNRSSLLVIFRPYVVSIVSPAIALQRTW